MATKEIVVCDDCDKELKPDDGRYRVKFAPVNVRKNVLRLRFTDLCEKCAGKRVKQLGGSSDTYSQEQLRKLNRAQLREIADRDYPDIKGRDKKDLIQSLTGKLIKPPKSEE